MMAANGVKSRHKSYTAYQDKWQRARDVCAGQDAIYAGGVRYLPLLSEEEFSEYVKRQHRTPFYNASWRTVAAFLGMMFRKPPQRVVPAALEPYLKDVTMSGVSFDNFARNVALEDLEVSRVGVLVDFPQAANVNQDGSPLTVAQAEALGLRPSMAMFTAEQIINWKYDFIGNRTVLSQVRLAETALVPKNEFESEEEKRIRVLDLFNGQYRVRLFKEDSEEQIGWDVYPLMDGQRMNFIPFYFIGPDGSDNEVTDPVLIDLFDLNIKHFQVSSDYETGCHFAGLPTPVVCGVPQQFGPNGAPIAQKLSIGSTTAWQFPDPNTKVEYLEFTGQGLTALEKNLERKEAQMAALGARMLTPDKAGVEAAETVAMRHSGENSILGSIAIAVSEGLEKALRTFARWAGINATDENCKYQLNRDFMPFAITPQALTALLGAVQAGKLSHEAFFELLQRGDLIDPETTFEDEQARIDTTAIPGPIAPPNSAPNPNLPPQEPQE